MSLEIYSEDAEARAEFWAETDDRLIEQLGELSADQWAEFGKLFAACFHAYRKSSMEKLYTAFGAMDSYLVGKVFAKMAEKELAAEAEAFANQMDEHAADLAHMCRKDRHMEAAA